MGERRADERRADELRTDELRTDELRTDELRIAVVGGAPLLQAGIIAALEPDPRLHLVGRAEDVRQAGHLLRQTRCDVLVLNTDSPYAEAVAVLAEQEGTRASGAADDAKVVVLTDDESQQELLVALQAGVQGYGIRRYMWPEDIRAAVLTVSRGFRWTCPMATRHLVNLALDETSGRRAGGMRRGPLSPRETEVLRLAADQVGEEQIAQALTLSRNTVKTYLRRIREKLQASSRGEAVRLGYQQGLISNGGGAAGGAGGTNGRGSGGSHNGAA